MSLEDLLSARFGFAAFRPGQRETIDALLAHRRALAIFPTGAGKSLCYQLPALTFDGVTLVVSPLIALMKDQIDFLRCRGVAAARLDASVTAQEWFEVVDQMRSGALKLLYVAPERFNNEKFLAAIQRVPISLFAIDEAHCISEWGHNFRPDYLKLADIAERIRAERILALTATATPAVALDIRTAFEIPAKCAIVTGFYRPNLSLATTPVAVAARDELLAKRLRSRKPGSTIVYVTLQRTAEHIAARLRSEGFSADAYHAGMEADERADVQDGWMASRAGIVVATIAFGMGIDKPDVRYIYHYNLPKSLESYSQEIGRAGRDGMGSVVELFATPDDVPILENFAYGDTPTTASLRSLVKEVLGGGEELALNLIELSNRHDMRPLVLRTALTYLELRKVLRQGTPFYSGYQFRPLEPPADIANRFPGEPGELVRAIFEIAKRGRTWWSMDSEQGAEALGQDRRRVVRALEVLEERQLIELRHADLRHRFTCVMPGVDVGEIVADLGERFLRRERQEWECLQDVLALVSHEGCQTAFLVAHFGEILPLPCGHCTYCKTGRVRSLPTPPPLHELPGSLDTENLESLENMYPHALYEPRSVARFLCGLTSPALTRARLTRHEMFGALANYRFAAVLDWATSARKQT